MPKVIIKSFILCKNKQTNKMNRLDLYQKCCIFSNFSSITPNNDLNVALLGVLNEHFFNRFNDADADFKTVCFVVLILFADRLKCVLLLDLQN